MSFSFRKRAKPLVSALVGRKPLSPFITCELKGFENVCTRMNSILAAK